MHCTAFKEFNESTDIEQAVKQQMKWKNEKRKEKCDVNRIFFFFWETDEANDIDRYKKY